MLKRYALALLGISVCALVIAGCANSNQPAPQSAGGAPAAAATSSLPSPTSLDLCPLPDLAPARLRSAPGYTQLSVSVVDHDGNSVTGLRRSDFTVSDGSKPLPISYFREESSAVTPISLVIVGDVSSSMYGKTVVSSNDQLTKVRHALDEAAGQLNQCDEIGLVLIGGTYQQENEPPLAAVTLAQDFTTDIPVVLDKMYSVLPSGEKRLGDGLLMGLNELSSAQYPRRALVLMTDGLDPAAIEQSAPVLAQIRKSGVSFWVVGIGDPNAQEGFLTRLRGSTRVDTAAEKKLAADGGGWDLYASPVSSDDGVSLAAAVGTIAGKLGNGYAIGVDAPRAAPSLTVALANHSTAVVRTETVPPAVLANAAAIAERRVATGEGFAAPKEIRSAPGYTEVAVTVKKSDGSYVDGLTKSDFTLSVNGTKQPIDFVGTGQKTPATVGILVDTSGSMTPKLPQARAAIKEFVKGLAPDDQVFLFAFSNKPYLLQPLTSDHGLVIKRLDILHAYGQTALFDVIIQGIAEAQKSPNKRTALLIITDGMDNASSVSADDVVHAAKHSGIVVYSIGIGDPNGAGGQRVVQIGPYTIGGDDSEHVDAQTLSRLAEANGGKSYIIPKVGSGEELTKDCDAISESLHDRHSYAIGFVAKAPRDYAPETIPIAVQVHAHSDYSVEAPASIPAPPSD